MPDYALNAELSETPKCTPNPDGVADCARTAPDGIAVEVLRWVKSEIFALNEDTLESYHAAREADPEGKQGAYARGRIAEAQSIARAMGMVIEQKIAQIKNTKHVS